MNFEWTDEQRQLKDSLARLLGDYYRFEQRGKTVRSGAGYDPVTWSRFAELGLTALPIAEEYGGLGGTAVDLLAVLEETGKVLALEPLVSSCVLAARAVALAGDEEQRQALLPRVAAGESQLAWAHNEPGSRHAPLWVEASARHVDGHWVLDGTKHHVIHASTADHFVVSARHEAAPDQADGLALFLIDSDAPGLMLDSHRLLDDTPAASLDLRAVPARLLGQEVNGAHALRAIVGVEQWGILAACAEALGAMQTAYSMTVSYLNTRQQFGRPLAQNQALRHRIAAMLVALETSRSMAMLAAIALDTPAVIDVSLELSRAKLLIGRHGRSVCQAAVQLHGGIGMTEEYAVGHYLRKLTVLEQLYGDSDAHAARLAARFEHSQAESHMGAREFAPRT